MGDLKSVEQLSLILGYIMPGLVILYVRAQFLTGRVGPHKDSLLSYFTLSIIYLTVTNVILPIITGSDAPLHEQTRHWLLIQLVGAVIFGALVGLNAHLGFTRRLLIWFGLYVPHVMASAWDWRFSRFPETLLTVTLKDGSRVSGWCGTNSFIGSDPKEQDLYIEQVYDVDEEGNWTLKTPGKGVYIAGGEVRLIEFIPRTAAGEVS